MQSFFEKNNGNSKVQFCFVLSKEVLQCHSNHCNLKMKLSTHLRKAKKLKFIFVLFCFVWDNDLAL